eukprot:TRINITY_DN522_c0_g1_i1.p1 TRINITY_DN522_c0_g1~~TRINITY_DN522_c0_g1_i1.p1  ORF type:complete len:270 (+),score=82.31 TRINITY_DN522_c0_g1_i1:236-1045(+)
MAAGIVSPPAAPEANVGGIPPSTRQWSEVSSCPSFHPLLPKAGEVLQELAQAGACPRGRGKRSVFDAIAPPPVSVCDFLIRLCKHAHCSPQVWLCTFANTDRMLSRAGLSFSPLNVHRIFLAGFVVTAKFRDDVSYGNKWYAAVAGVPCAELNILEGAFLDMLGWNCCTTPDEYRKYELMLEDDDSDESGDEHSECGMSSEGETDAVSRVSAVDRSPCCLGLSSHGSAVGLSSHGSCASQMREASVSRVAAAAPRAAPVHTVVFRGVPP